ncbi:MAG TPA: GNAT family N-acetyltransferase, partial [Lachnospiraceae bacterium]|nr:GNAT family N-acetyltransferase [Lachnospiraceae bacterium]
GFWNDRYCPYVLMDGDTIVSNVSANLMVFNFDGVEKRYIQIGTVMTEEAYRKLGLGRYLMEKVIEEWKGKVDGFYLFANDSAVNFYPKFGFQVCEQYQYSKQIDENVGCTAKRYLANQLDLSIRQNQKGLYMAVSDSRKHATLQMIDYPELVLFYALMGVKVFLIEELEAYIVVEEEVTTLTILEVFSKNDVNLDDVINSLANSNTSKVKLGFTPLNSQGYQRELLCRKDLTLYILGEDLELIEKEGLMFPELSHA